MREIKTIDLLKLIFIIFSFWFKPVMASAEISSDFKDELIKKIAEATPWTIIELPHGRFSLNDSILINKSGITLRGQGMNKTILSFQQKESKTAGFVISAQKVHLENFAIEDTPGDAVEIKDARDIFIDHLIVEKKNNLPQIISLHGITIRKSEKVYIQYSILRNASSAGIYIDQSRNIIASNSLMSENAIGIKIQNSQDTEIYENLITENSAGILVVDLPQNQIKGQRIKIYHNLINNNNETFEHAFENNENSINAHICPGTGIMIVGTDLVEIFKNEIESHQTSNIFLANFLMTKMPIENRDYDPYPESLSISNNRMKKSGYRPYPGPSQVSKSIISKLVENVDLPFPQIIFDGQIDSKKFENGQLPEKLKICIQNNGEADFINIDFKNDFRNLSRDLGPHQCPISPDLLEEKAI